MDFMPARYALVEWEPWHSMKMHQLPVDNYIVYYLVDDKERAVTVARIFYGGRDIEGKYSLQGTTQSRYLTGGVPPVRFSM